MVTEASDVKQANSNKTLYDRQIELENEMRMRGAERDRKKQAQNVDTENESLTMHGKKLLKASIENYIREIDLYLQEVSRGPKFVASKYMQMLDTPTLAVIATKRIIDKISSVTKFTSTAISLASRIEDEIYFRQFSESNRALFETVDKDLNKRSGHYEYRRHKHIQAAKKDGFKWEKWDTRDKVHVGEKLISLFIKATNLCKVEKNWKRKRAFNVLVATDKTLEWIKSVNDFNEYLNPDYLPTLIKPKEWVEGQSIGGGYYSNILNPIFFITGRNITSHRNFLSEIDNYVMPGVYNGVNALQNTMYSINSDLLLVAETVFNNDDRNRGGLVTSKLLDLPNKPHDINTNKQSLSRWKSEATTVYTINQKLKSKRLATAKILWIASKYKDEKQLGFPGQVDFRSRFYYVPSYLNPQGTDLAKALLKFANAKPIGESGFKWLCIHLANNYGYDKVSLKDREKWALDNKDKIIACSQAPFENTFWEEADNPWQFLAACMEFDKVNTYGLSYKSNLIISIDGSCNGLQHFSALFRDEKGGLATNLKNTEIPQDIYQIVCDKTIEILKKSNEPIAKQWLEFGIDRKATKRPVMVLPYGGTRFSCCDFVDEYIEDRVSKGEHIPFDDRGTASRFLADIIWNSIGDTVKKAREAMDWLQQVARLISKTDKPVHWNTPLGFPVKQAYYDQKDLLVKTKMMGRIRFKSTTDKIAKRKQSQGVSPNFIHSLDATAMFLTIDHCLYEGITDLAMVHDSYGTLAADVDQLSECTRNAFIQLYTETDPIQHFKKQLHNILSEKQLAKVPPLPDKGTLEISEILKAKYFFS